MDCQGHHSSFLPLHTGSCEACGVAKKNELLPQRLGRIYTCPTRGIYHTQHGQEDLSDCAAGMNSCLEVRALAQSLAGLGAKAFNWPLSWSRAAVLGPLVRLVGLEADCVSTEN